MLAPIVRGKGSPPKYSAQTTYTSKLNRGFLGVQKVEAPLGGATSHQSTTHHQHLPSPTMAALPIPSPALLRAFLPIARAQILHPTSRHLPVLSSFLPAALAPIPTLLDTIWDGLLNAVPKKKTSHMKKRTRQLASGKGLKDVTALNHCSACGRVKRAHVLCPYCVSSIRRWISTGFKTRHELDVEADEKLRRVNEERKARGAKPLKEEMRVKDEERVKKEDRGAKDWSLQK